MKNNNYTFEISTDWSKNLNGIYAIYCKITNKYYVGLTRHAEGFLGRWTDHRTLLRAKKHDNKYLQNSYNKYGENNFYFKILEIMDKEDKFMSNKEWYWIGKLKSMYNENGYNIDIRDKYRKRKIVDRSKVISNLKTYQLISPNGQVITFTGLNKFCKENNLAAPNIIALLNGKIKSCHGYKSINPNFHKKVKIYKLIASNGKIIEFNSIRKFCRENNLEFAGIQRLLTGKLKKSQGYKNVN